MSDLIDRQAAIDAICNACGKIDCDKMDKCEKLQLPPANCSEFPNNSDTISRQAAIDALNEQIKYCDKAIGSFDISMKDEYAVKVERASLMAYAEKLKALPSAEPECKKPVFKTGESVCHVSYADGTGGFEKNKWADWICPDCGWFVGEQYIPRRHNQQKCNYCAKCGCAIDWSDADMKGAQG